MPKSLKFDPSTRDVIRDGKGWFKWTPNADTTVMHQLQVHGDKAWHDAELGSLLYDLKKLQVRPDVAIPNEARRALNVLVSRGRISNLEVSAEVAKTTLGRVNVATKFRDTSTGQVVPTKIPVGR